MSTPPSRRSRTLSEEERAQWSAVARTAKPLRRKAKVADAAPAPPPEPAAPDRAAAPPPAPHGKPAAPARPAPPPLAPLAKRERGRLARGRTDIDARLDLHGMTQARAHAALLRFLQRAQAEGASFVLVITGKGKAQDGGAESERGVLRRQTPLWLGLPEFRSLVVSFEEAHVGHGGAGALYVRVRRAR